VRGRTSTFRSPLPSCGVREADKKGKKGEGKKKKSCRLPIILPERERGREGEGVTVSFPSETFEEGPWRGEKRNHQEGHKKKGGVESAPLRKGGKKEHWLVGVFSKKE